MVRSERKKKVVIDSFYAGPFSDNNILSIAFIYPGPGSDQISLLIRFLYGFPGFNQFFLFIKIFYRFLGFNQFYLYCVFGPCRTIPYTCRTIRSY